MSTQKAINKMLDIKLNLVYTLEKSSLKIPSAYVVMFKINL